MDTLVMYGECLLFTVNSQAIFNHACACVGCGRDEEAFHKLQGLVACSGVSKSDLATDRDLER
eukprot:9029614-Pyramimonas_sp.AAC.1